MTQTFEDRVEEVLGLLHGMAWPLLDEPDKTRVVGKVVRGIDKGDSPTAWARALGVAVSTLRSRADRFSRSEPVDGRPDPASIARRDRYMKQGFKEVLQDPELLEELLEEPSVKRRLVDAAQGVVDATPAHIHAEPTVAESWETWLSQGNTWLMKGARLMDRTEGRLNGHAAFGPVLYQRIVEKKLDTELREFFENEEATR